MLLSRTDFSGGATNYTCLSLSSTAYNAPAGRRVPRRHGKLGPEVEQAKITMGDRGYSIRGEGIRNLLAAMEAVWRLTRKEQRMKLR